MKKLTSTISFGFSKTIVLNYKDLKAGKQMKEAI